MAVANSDGVSIYYERHGAGPAVLFVHGSGGHHAAWWQQVAALRHRFTVLTVDLRGFGKSDSSMPEFDGQDFPGDILAVHLVVDGRAVAVDRGHACPSSGQGGSTGSPSGGGPAR